MVISYKVIFCSNKNYEFAKKTHFRQKNVENKNWGKSEKSKCHFFSARKHCSSFVTPVLGTDFFHGDLVIAVKSRCTHHNPLLYHNRSGGFCILETASCNQIKWGFNMFFLSFLKVLWFGSWMFFVCALAWISGSSWETLMGAICWNRAQHRGVANVRTRPHNRVWIGAGDHGYLLTNPLFSRWSMTNGMVTVDRKKKMNTNN